MRVLWALEAWGQRRLTAPAARGEMGESSEVGVSSRADAGVRSQGGGVLGVSGGGDGGHSHARFWAQAQAVRAQWRVQVQAGPGRVQGHGQAFSALSSGLTETLFPTPEDRMQVS